MGHSFGNLLRNYRRTVGLTQAALADRARISVQAVGALERGTRRFPHRDTLDRLAGALGLTDDQRRSFAAAASRANLPRPSVAEDPPARPVPRQLPPDVPMFTGRADALAELDLRLVSPTGAVVVSAIAGTGGVGKTALAVHWAWREAEHFPDGQLYLNLRGYDTRAPIQPEHALAILLRELGVDARDVPPTLDERVSRYRTLLADRRMLIVLDNANSADQVRDLLPGSASCLVLITSRDSLTGLVARDGAYRIDLDRLPEGEATTLLRGLIGARIDTEPDAAASLGRLCAHLPLALRIAAELARSRPGRPLAAVVHELADERRRLDLLDAGGDAHASIRAVLAWSYCVLPPDVAALFRLLGCHPGMIFDHYAAAALANIEPVVAERLISQLARAHLVEDCGGRYEMHDLLRVYARELADTLPGSDRDAAIARLFDYYRAAAGVAMDQVHPALRDQRPTVSAQHIALPPLTNAAIGRKWLRAEVDNLVATVEFGSRNGFAEHATQITSITFRFLETTALWAEALSMAAAALNAARGADDRSGEAEVLRIFGAVYEATGQPEQSLEHLNRSLELRSELGDYRGMSLILNNIGTTLATMGRLAEATSCYERSLALQRDLGDRHGVAVGLLNASTVQQERGDYAGAHDNLRQALAIFRELGDRLGEGHALCNIGQVMLLSAEYEVGLAPYYEALGIYREIDSRKGETYALDGIGGCLEGLGRRQDATRFYDQALALATETSNLLMQARVLNHLGSVSLRQGHTSAAHAAYVRALSITEPAGLRFQQATALRGLAKSLPADSRPDEARNRWLRALTLFEQLGAIEAAADVRADLAAAE